jgi:hypothetical protein
MYVALMDRAQLLSFLPEGGVVAEIGVALGDFSERILREGRARELHLIDPWIHQDREDYLVDDNNVPADQQEQRYLDIQTRFAAEITDGRVHVQRAFSQDKMPEFEDASLDWVYVDGMHTYDAVTRDLSLSWDKIKDDGFILGHDFTNGPLGQKQNFGVVEAVNQFVVERKGIFVAMTMEVYPTYMLAKSVTPRLATFLEEFLYHTAFVTEIRGIPHRFEHKKIRVKDKGIHYFSY